MRDAPRIVNVDVPLLTYASFARLSYWYNQRDIHCRGPTIKRAFLQRIVDQVNQLGRMSSPLPAIWSTGV